MFSFYLNGYDKNGDVMKKLFLFFLFIISFSFINISSDNKYIYLRNDDSFNIYSISIDNLNTKNINKYLSDFKVLKVNVDVNPLYKNILGDVSFNLQSDDLVSEMEILKSNYLSLIKKNSFLDYDYLYINGIKISDVLVYTSGRKLYDFSLNNNVKINNYP